MENIFIANQKRKIAVYAKHLLNKPCFKQEQCRFVTDRQVCDPQTDKQVGRLLKKILLFDLTALETLFRRSNYLSYSYPCGPNLPPLTVFELINSGHFDLGTPLSKQVQRRASNAGLVTDRQIDCQTDKQAGRQSIIITNFLIIEQLRPHS